jgi:hypothetical protein
MPSLGVRFEHDSEDSNRIECTSCRFVSNRTHHNLCPVDSIRIERGSGRFGSNRMWLL